MAHAKRALCVILVKSKMEDLNVLLWRNHDKKSKQDCIEIERDFAKVENKEESVVEKRRDGKDEVWNDRLAL